MMLIGVHRQENTTVTNIQGGRGTRHGHGMRTSRVKRGGLDGLRTQCKENSVVIGTIWRTALRAGETMTPKRSGVTEHNDDIAMGGDENVPYQ